MNKHGFLGRRLLRVGKLEAPVRRIVFATFAVFLAVAFATAFSNSIGGPDLPNTALFHFPRNIFIIGVAIVIASVSLLLAGAAHLKTRWRYPVIVIIMLAIAATRFAAPGILPDKIFIPLLWLPIPFALFVAVLAWFAPRFRITTALAWSVAIIVSFAAAVFAATFFFNGIRLTDTVSVSSTAYAVTVFTVVMFAAALAVTPAIMVVGFDYAELGVEAVTAGLGFLSKFRNATLLLRIVLPAAGLGLMSKLIFDFREELSANIGFMATLALLLAAGSLVFLALARRRPHLSSGAHMELGYLPVLCVAICIGASSIINLSFSETIPGYAIIGGEREFAFHKPDGVLKMRAHPAKSLSELAAADLTFGPGSPIISLSIAGTPQTGPSLPFYSLSDLTGQRSLPNDKVSLEAPGAGGWRTGQVSYGRYVFLVFGRRDSPELGRGAGDWYVTCGGLQANLQKLQAVCSDVKNSFSVSSSGGIRHSRPAVQGWSGLFLAAAAGFLFWAQRRARAGGSTSVLDFTCWAFLLTAMRWSTGYLFQGANDPQDSFYICADLFVAMLGLLSVFSLATTLKAGHKARQAVNQALASTIVVAGLFYAYVYAVRGAEALVIRGIVILVALSGELLLSGASLNPTAEKSQFSRSSRVLIFIGYLLLVADCVFVFSRQELATGITIGSFDTEEIAANALTTLGCAFILCRLMNGLLPIWKREAEGA